MSAPSCTKFGKHLLLTGAGFTANFGAPLSGGVWAHLFGHPSVQARSRVRDLLCQHLDFEVAYETAMSDDVFDDSDRVALKTALFETLGYIDRTITVSDTGLRPVHNQMGIQEFIASFVGAPSELGFVFTLNYDLLLERRYGSADRAACLSLPGVAAGGAWVPDPSDLGPTKQLLPPGRAHYGNETLQNLRTRLAYIKLHGSHDWASIALGGQPVVGTRKPDQIAKEPLLEWYAQLLTNVLGAGEAKLLCFGYGFRDAHINATIATAVRDAGLRIHIVDPSEPSQLRNHLETMKSADIWYRGLEGYYQCTFKDLFPGGGPPGGTTAWHQLRLRFFGECHGASGTTNT